MNKGTSRKERAASSLNPSDFRLDGRTLSDLLEEVQEFSKQVVYEEKGISTSWEAFFEEALPYLKAVENDDFSGTSEKNCPPHLSLFLTFLGLFQSVQKQFNALSKEHLLFFYKKVLDQEKLGILGDKVYVFPQLARNIDQFYLEKGSALVAGKDENKNNIIYKTEKDLFLNKAFVSRVHAIYNGKTSQNPSVYIFRNLPSLYEGLENTPEGWAPFGDPQILRESAEIGFAVSSAVLFLPEGKRRITISLNTGNQKVSLKDKNMLLSSLEAHLSTIDGWLIKPIENVEIQAEKIIFSIGISNTDPSIQVQEEGPENSRMSSEDPVIKIIFKQGYNYELYALFQKIKIYEVRLAVKVENLETLKVKNDYGILDAARAFQPFGYVPVVGSNLYLHANELVSKNIISAVITFNWKGLPENFKTYYEGYLGQTNSLVENKEDFRVTLAIRRNKEWIPLKNNEDTTFGLFDERLKFHLAPDNDPARKSNPDQGMIRISFAAPSRAFGHNLYPVVYTRSIMEQARQREAPIPNPPYTPSLESVCLDYEAVDNIKPVEEHKLKQQFFYIEPFGVQKITTAKPPFPLVSQNFNSGGQLFLGIEKLKPPAQVSIFFDIKEENTKDLPEVKFSYLSRKGWRRISESQLSSDSTAGLKKTGIISLNIPADACDNRGEMPKGLYWVKIETPALPGRFDRIISLRTNAVLASLDVPRVDPFYSVNKLVPGSISSFKKKINHIQNVEQPYNSFGGRPAEDDQAFFTRVSERLAHKNRAVNAWDFEHLVLQEFPEIYQVICNSCQNPKGETKAGHVHILLIPKIRTSSQNFIQKPVVSASQLQKIRAYLESLISPHIELSLANPSFEELEIHADISFRDNVDAGFYLKKLETALKKFLSPWAFDQQEKIEMNKLYRSSIIKFIELQPYVKFIASIKIYRNQELITANEIFTGENALLISSNTHRLEAVEAEALLCQTNQGIDQMIVDINFQID